MRQHLPGLLTGILVASVGLPLAAMAANGDDPAEVVEEATEEEPAGELDEDLTPEPDPTPEDEATEPPAGTEDGEDEQDDPPTDDDRDDTEVDEGGEGSVDDGRGAVVSQLARCAPRGPNWRSEEIATLGVGADGAAVTSRGQLLEQAQTGGTIVVDGEAYPLIDADDAAVLCEVLRERFPHPSELAAERREAQQQARPGRDAGEDGGAEQPDDDASVGTPERRPGPKGPAAGAARRGGPAGAASGPPGRGHGR